MMHEIRCFCLFQDKKAHCELKLSQVNARNTGYIVLYSSFCSVKTQEGPRRTLAEFLQLYKYVDKQIA